MFYAHPIHETKNDDIAQKLYEAFSSELHIYNQVLLKKRKQFNFISQTTSIEVNTQELVLLFQLKGELQGRVICRLDLKDKKDIQSNFSRLQSLFAESMNILLGQFLTEVEEKFCLMSVISHPEFLLQKRKMDLMKRPSSHFSIILMTEYELQAMKDSYHCSIYIFANPKILKEV